MTTGKIEYSPDYKSKSPKLPKDFGLMKAICTDGKHRFLPNAPKCGCGQIANPTVERTRLERTVIDKVKLLRKAELAAQIPSDFDVVEAQRALRTTADALLAFEANHK